MIVAKSSKNTTVSLTEEFALNVKTYRVSEGFWDDEIEGFGIKITRAGKRQYVFRHYHKGILQIVLIAHCNMISFKEAKSHAIKQALLVQSGGMPKGLIENEKRMLVRDFWHKFMLPYMRKEWKESTFSRFESRRKEIVNFFGDMYIDDIDRDDMLRFHRHLRRHKFGESVFTKCVGTVLKPMLRMAQREGYRKIEDHTFQMLPLYKSKDVSKSLSDNELARMIKLLKEPSKYDEEARKALLMLNYTGMRRKEVCNLQWKEVCFESKEIRLHDSKTGWKKIPISDITVSLLKSIKKFYTNKHVFHNKSRSKAMPTSTLDTYWNRFRKKHGFDIRLHDLRHTYATHVYELTGNIFAVKELLGHSAVSTTEKYLRKCLGKQSRKAVNVHDLFMKEIEQGRQQARAIS